MCIRDRRYTGPDAEEGSSEQICLPHYEPAVMVIAGVTPIDLHAKERRVVNLRKVEVAKEVAKHRDRPRTLERWQGA